ncbi:MAG TPA: YdcF family protein [Stellaceae bacterium]|nr:YdcF family protein [Stellaceae bacterium]
MSDTSATPTDAIVVLTGGRLRLEAGLALLAAGKGKRLFISGVNPRVDRGMLLRILGPAAEREACCIVLGRRSDDTFGNAVETAAWMRREGYTSLHLVTSWYHMRRALLEFRRAMPRVRIIPQPVFATHVDPEGWWGRHGAVLLVLGEYEKYLASWLWPALGEVMPSPSPPLPTLETNGIRHGVASLPPR